MSKFNEMPIILIQWKQDPSSKIYYNFNSRQEAVEYIFKLYEEYLGSEIKNLRITRDTIKVVKITKVISFLYSFYDFAYLELKDNQDKIVYAPYGKDWFCEIILETIKKLNK